MRHVRPAAVAPRRALPLLLALTAVLASCQRPEDAGAEAEPASATAAPSVDQEEGEAIFAEAGAESGLDFVHFNGMSGELYFCEMVGPGGAVADVDNDGDLDVFLIQGQMLGPGKTPGDALFPPRHPTPLGHRLYRNDLTAEAGGGSTARFVDVTEESGLAALAGHPGYGMGVAAGDFDNDGWVDLYVTQLGPNQLLRNLGPGPGGEITFADVTAAAGADDRRWSVSAAVLDFDRDGWLDLYVGNYVDYSVATDKRCRAATGAPDYCGPLSYLPASDRLLRNRGTGEVSFEDVTHRAGVDGEFGGALGVVAADLDLDGWMDIYVANDGVANQMWINQGGRSGPPVTFLNEAVFGGSALNRDGMPEAGMGVDAGDYDNDGDEDLFLAHLTQETNTIYRNNGRGQFDDATDTTGLGAASWEMTGFGTKFFDYDNDGWLDVLVLNGAVKHVEALVRAADPYPIHQPNQLYRNLGGEGSGAGDTVRFADVTARGGPAFVRSEVSRGAAVGDLDNDGDADVLVANNAGPARLLLNQVGNRRAWLGLRLLVRDGRRDALGAWVEVVRPRGGSVWRRASSGGSYASAGDPRILVGLGDVAQVDEVRVTWPDGARERFPVDGVSRYLTLRAGTGDAM